MTAPAMTSVMAEQHGYSLPTQPAWYAGFLFTLLFSVYGLSYSGTFTSDDEHIFAASAQNLARVGSLDTPQVYGNSRLQALRKMPFYTTVEPGQAVVGATLVLWADRAGVGAAHVLFWLNPLVTAVSGCVVFLTVVVLGYSERVAILATLLYGSATIAWPYATTFFRDPLAALLLAVAYLSFEWGQQARRSTRGEAAAWTLTATFLAAAALVKSTAAVAIPILLVVALWRSHRRSTRALVTLTAVLLIGLGVLLVCQLSPTNGAFGRFSWPYLRFLVDAAWGKPRVAVGQSLLGPLLSPGKSLFVFSPVLVLALVSLGVESGRRRRGVPVSWMLLLSLVAVHALFYDKDWWLPTNWGLRFTLLAIPLLAAACAPALEVVLARAHACWRAAFWGLLALGVLVQVEGLVVPKYCPFGLVGAEPVVAGAMAIWDPLHSAAIVCWQLLLDGQWAEFAIVRLWDSQPVVGRLLLVGWLMLLGLSAWGLHGLRTGANDSRRTAVLLAVGLALSAAMPAGTLRALTTDPAYFGGRSGFQAAITFLKEKIEPGDVVLVQAYGQPLWTHYMNHSRRLPEWYGLPWYFPKEEELARIVSSGDPSHGLDRSTVMLFNSLPTDYQRAWLINAHDAPPGCFELEDRWLGQHYSRVGRWLFGRTGEVSVAAFTLYAEQASE